MAWDATAILNGDPDQPAEINIRMLGDPAYPLPLCIVECAANLDIAIKIEKPESSIPDMAVFDLTFYGRCLDLSELDMRMTAWQSAHNVLNKSEEEVSRKRMATSASPSPDQANEGSTES
jgi:hypothetical protein